MGVPVTYNLRNLAERKGTTIMTALGIGLTVAVLIISSAFVVGLERVFAGSGDPRQALVLRKGVDAELSSSVSTESYQVIRQLPGVALTAEGEPMVSPEGLTVINLANTDGQEMNISVRGLLPIGLAMRKIDLVQGSMFKPGLRQVIVGESTAKRYPAARVGGKIRFGKGVWDVVGIFRAGESASNSEMWADLNQIRGDFEQQGGSSSLLVRLNSADQLQAFSESVAGDQRLQSHSVGESAYYAALTSSGAALSTLGFFVAIVMAIGSAFAATNTMYAAVARRSREIGTLRALGFGRWSILRSFMLESICLALIGGIIGVLLALPINGMTTGVGNMATFSEIAFKFKVGPNAISKGLLFAVVIGALGGFLPAYSASKKGIIAAMRDV